MFQKIKSNILAIGMSCLLTLCGWMWWTNTQLADKLDTAKAEIVQIKNNLSLMESRLTQLTILSKKTDEIVQERTSSFQEKDRELSLTLQEIDNITIQGIKNEDKKMEAPVSVMDAVLDDNVARMLSDVCRQVAGKPCPNS